jgi:RHS repeat-associated protein
MTNLIRVSFLFVCGLSLWFSPSVFSQVIPPLANDSLSPFPPFQAPPGATTLAGQVLTVEGKPLQNVTVQVEGREEISVRTDVSGRFWLSAIDPGINNLLIDGRSASDAEKSYGVFIIRVQALAHQTNVLPYNIWMPEIDTAHAVKIDSPTQTEVVITTARIPGLELHIPPGTVIYDHEGKVVTELSITAIDNERPPFPLPVLLQFQTHVTIQPGGAYLLNKNGVGARLIYPNSIHAFPGTEANLWHYDPQWNGWYIYGHGSVSQEGKQIIPNPGVSLYEFMVSGLSLSALNPQQPADFGPSPGNGDDPPPTPGKRGKKKKGTGGDPVDLGTGLFLSHKTDLMVPDTLPLHLVRTYRPRDIFSRAFGIGATHSYDMFLWGPFGIPYIDLILPDGGRIHYDEIQIGAGFASNGTQDPTGAVYEHTATPTVFYKSQIRFHPGSNGWDLTNPSNGWNLTLKDGTTYFFGHLGSLQYVRDRYGNQISIVHSNNETGTITRVTTPNGRWIEFTYDTNNPPRITQATDNLGRVVSYIYNLGRLWKVTDPNGGVTEYTYDGSNRMVTLKDALGIVFLANVYDSSGRVIQQTQADGTKYQFAYIVDGGGKITQTDVTDPRGKLRRVTFNSSGYTLTDTYALGLPEQQTTTYEVQDGTNLVLSVTDALGRKTAYAYDTMGNVTGITRLAGTMNAVTTTFTYEATLNRITSTIDPLNHTTSFAYDAMGSLTTLTDPLGNPTTFTYNPAGKPLSVTDALGNRTTFSYDMSDLATVADALGNTTVRFTDSVGRLLIMTNPLGNRTRTDYDVLNRLAQMKDPLTGITSFSYDSNGNLLSVKDAKNQTTSYTYDTMDRLQRRTDPLAKFESFGYDSSGNLTSFTDRKNQATAVTYDALDRRSVVTYADSSTTRYTWDKGNRLTQVVDSLSGTITRTYDDLDRLTAETTPQGAVTYTYDAAGRRTGLTVVGQPQVTYSYDASNQLIGITQGASTVTIVYDAAGRRTSVTVPNGITVVSGYDAASHLTSLTYKKGATVLGDLAYSYDKAGNRTQLGGSWARTGLPLAVASTGYDAANRQFTFGGTNLTYDFNGNLTTAQDAFGTATYSWDSRNRLVSITAPGFSAGFAYDALGRRTGKTVQGVTTNYLYDGLNPVQEKAGASVTANILTGLGIDEYFTRTDTAGARSVLPDALGSTLALTDSTGTLQTQYTYEPFGNTSVGGATSTNSFQYTARENDGTGLYYYRARYYSPRLQRFISEDPIGFYGGDLNVYEYVKNRPILFNDPTGKEAQVIPFPPPPPGGRPRPPWLPPARPWDPHDVIPFPTPPAPFIPPEILPFIIPYPPDVINCAVLGQCGDKKA